MSQFIKFYFTSSMLNMFWTLMHSSSGACDFSIASPHCLCVGVSVWLVGVVSVWQAEAWSLILQLCQLQFEKQVTEGISAEQNSSFGAFALSFPAGTVFVNTAYSPSILARSLKYLCISTTYLKSIIIIIDISLVECLRFRIS